MTATHAASIRRATGRPHRLVLALVALLLAGAAIGPAQALAASTCAARACVSSISVAAPTRYRSSVVRTAKSAARRWA